MILTKSWPIDMNYLTCDNYTGSNTPERSIDLRSYFMDISEPTTYGQFSFANDNGTFNGYSAIAFDMDILSVTLNVKNEYHERHIGKWTAGLTTHLQLESNRSIKPLKIYRVYTVLVRLIFK